MAVSDGAWVTSTSLYGVGGSNLHVVLESAETVAHLTRVVAAPPIHKKPPYLFSISSLTEPTLGCWKDALLSAYYGLTDDRVLRSIAHELGQQTCAYPSRAFTIGSSLDASLKFSKPVLRHSNASPKLCLVFAGEGSQHIFMDHQLAESYPTFLSAIAGSLHSTPGTNRPVHSSIEPCPYHTSRPGCDRSLGTEYGLFRRLCYAWCPFKLHWWPS